MACGPNFQPIEMVRGLGEVIGKNLNILVGALGQFTKRGWGSHLKCSEDSVCRHYLYFIMSHTHATEVIIVHLFIISITGRGVRCYDHVHLTLAEMPRM